MCLILASLIGNRLILAGLKGRLGTKRVGMGQNIPIMAERPLSFAVLSVTLKFNAMSVNHPLGTWLSRQPLSKRLST